MFQAPKSYNQGGNPFYQEKSGAPSLGCSGFSLNIQKNESSGDVWGGIKTKEQRTESTSLGWGVNTPRQDRNGFSSLSYLPTNSPFVNIGSSNNNDSLPKFSDTFCNAGAENTFSRSSSSSDFSWSGSSSRSSRRNSSETALFGDPRKKLNWDKIVDKVFKEEIAKLADTVQNIK